MWCGEDRSGDRRRERVDGFPCSLAHEIPQRVLARQPWFGHAAVRGKKVIETRAEERGEFVSPGVATAPTCSSILRSHTGNRDANGEAVIATPGIAPRMARSFRFQHTPLDPDDSWTLHTYPSQCWQ